jgi:hypothetical protein
MVAGVNIALILVMIQIHVSAVKIGCVFSPLIKEEL